MSLQSPPAQAPSIGKTPPKDQFKRATKIFGQVDTPKPSCSKEISIGIFFDGTNNNRDRDEPVKGHSNIVVLFNAHKDKFEDGYFRFYIPGVGTKFKEIGELHESSEGKSTAKGGDARIHYAMIQIYNAVHRAVFGNELLVKYDEAFSAFTGEGFFAAGIVPIHTQMRKQFFTPIKRRLVLALHKHKPLAVKQINLSIFGFSRGAAQARAFSNFLLDCCEAKGDEYTFCEIPLKFQFMGLFDTVASVGLANSSPVGRGFFGWGGAMSIPKAVKRTVHYVAGNEIRQNFPLSSAREGNAYPDTCTEVAFPGAHSDVGGGYGPNDQGKATAGRDLMVSQIPLVCMYLEARKAGVQLMTEEELKKSKSDSTINDLQIHDTLAARYKAYIQWSKVGANEVQLSLSEHMRHYWRWRSLVMPKFYKLESFNAAGDQDRADMQASDHDYKVSLKYVEAVELHEHRKKNLPIVTGIMDTTGTVVDVATTVVTHINLPVALATELYKFVTTSNDEKFDPAAISAAVKDRSVPKDIPELALEFYDHHIHDSHASFRLLEPLTQEERDAVVLRVIKKRVLWEQSSKNPKLYDGVQPKLIPIEERIYKNHQAILDGKAAADSYPVMTDDDLEEIRKINNFANRNLVHLVTEGRRESGSILRFRVVFDGKNKLLQQKETEAPQKKTPARKLTDEGLETPLKDSEYAVDPEENVYSNYQKRLKTKPPQPSVFGQISGKVAETKRQIYNGITDFLRI